MSAIKNSSLGVTCHRVTPEEFNTIERQLGRSPRKVTAVVNRCRAGNPRVILTGAFLGDGTPFPTIFWLSCPFLTKEIAKLEENKWIAKFEDRVRDNSEFRQSLNEAHADYRRLRRLLHWGSPEAVVGNRRGAKDPSSAGALADKRQASLNTGVGGVGDSSRVKCLHAHYAHFLATGKNPVGRMVHEIIGDVDCGGSCG